MNIINRQTKIYFLIYIDCLQLELNEISNPLNSNSIEKKRMQIDVKDIENMFMVMVLNFYFF
jgi:hypothetical protein